MKKNIIFDKNVQQQNGIDVNQVNATNIIVETISQTGDLSINGNLSISNDASISGNLNVSEKINGLTIFSNQNNAILIGQAFPTNSTIGSQVAAIGDNPLTFSTGAQSVVAIGDNTMFGGGNYQYCTAVGQNAMRFDLSANYCSAFGYNSGGGGSHNFSTAIGAYSSYNGDHQIVLGTSTETTIIEGNLAIGKTSVTPPYVVDISGNLNVSGNVSATSYTTTSDRRIKENIININENIDLLKPRKYLNRLTNKEEFGLIADEIEQIFPNLVNGNKDGEILQSVNYIQLIALIIKEVKELKEKINQIS